MLTKAIVEEATSSYAARIRIPIYHQIESSPYATPLPDLPLAAICSPPGITMALRKGDIVFVDFELDSLDKPIIVGCLSRENSSSSCNIDAQSLNVKVDCNLPGDTSFGAQKDLDDINQENVFIEIAEGGGPGSDIVFYTD